MDDTIRLDIAIESDAEEIRNLMVEVESDEANRWYINGERPFIPGYASIDMQKYHMWQNKYYKIIYNGKLAGVLLIAYTGREHARVDRLYLNPRIQNKGLGSQVIKMMEEMHPMVTLWTLDTVQKSPRNHRFYEKNGYIKIGEDEKERYYQKKINNAVDHKYIVQQKKDFKDQSFRECDMRNIDVYETNIKDSSFTNVSLYNTLYQNSNISKSRFSNVNLSDAVIGDSNMNNIEICHVSLAKAYIHDTNLDLHEKKASIKIERCELMNGTISDSNLKNVSISNCNIEGMIIDGLLVSDLIRLYKTTRL